MQKPEPIHKETICSVCGLDWKRHGKDPTLEKCVKLLMADLASEKLRTTPVMPHPYPVPYPYPAPAIPQPRPWPYTWRQPTFASPNTSAPTPSHWQLTSASGNYQ